MKDIKVLFSNAMSKSPTTSTEIDSSTPPNEENLDDSVIETNPSSTSSSNALEISDAKKRNFSGRPSSICGDTKRTNFNDSYLSEDPQTDINAPSWVKRLFQEFESLKKDVKSIDEKLDKLESFKTEIIDRVEKVEAESTALKQSVSELDESVKTNTENFQTLKNATGKRLKTLESQSAASEQKLNEIEKSVQFMNEACEDLKKEVTKLTNHNSVLKKSFDSLSSQVNSNEQHNQNECLLLHGIQEFEKETPQSRSIFMKEINQHLGFQFDGNEIRRAHRLGQKRSNGKPRPIIARFWSSEVRNNIFFQKKGCKNKGISITENLTKRNMQVKLEAEKKYGSGNVWTREGRIFAKNNNTIIPVPT